MVQTRSMSVQINMEAITKMIDQKLSELKESLLTEFKSEIDAYILKQKEDLELFVNSRKDDLPVHNNSSELTESVKVIQEHVHTLKTTNSKLEVNNSALSKNVDDLQQYIRRPNIRIFGVSVPDKESSEDVEKLVKNLINKYGMDIPDSSIDRAHRIGRIQKGNGKDTQPIIVRFTTFRDRTKFYKARKGIQEKYGVSLDLTVDRLALLKDARKLVENEDGIKFAYTDINCKLRVLTKTGKHIFFDSICDLQNIIVNFK